MDRKTIIIVTAALLIVLSIFILSSRSAIYEFYIESEIEKANYCETEDDCVDAGSKCPFGCYNYVNKAEAERISGLLGSFDSDCIYDCAFCADVRCVDHKCEPVCD